jgi:hypothetical protein
MKIKKAWPFKQKNLQTMPYPTPSPSPGCASAYYINLILK